MAKRRKKTRLDKNSRIAIVGSGLGGLGAAISLKRAGFTNLVVFERDASVDARRDGYGLTITYNPQGPLAHLGILEQVAELDCPSRCHYIFQPNGNVLGYYGNAFLPNRGCGQRGNMRIPRQVLRRLLFDRVTSSVQFGKNLVDFQRDSENNRLSLVFEDGSTEEGVGLLIGADGIRSRVLQLLLAPPLDTGLNHLGIMIILGIADFNHPLLDERGFYTLDGNHRLFTMPYEGSRADNGSKRRIMWQLSYNCKDPQVSQQLSIAGPEALRDEVLRRCAKWHEPVVEMVKSTPLDTIWGTGLMDRDPEELVKRLAESASTRVVILGDAAHSMSPFKGQGANQALMDGPLLASWLERASMDSAITGFHREMAQRSGVKVRASREAAAFLHSPQVLKEQQEFAGVRKDCVHAFRADLCEHGICASSGSCLDEKVRRRIGATGFGEPVKRMSNTNGKSQNVCAVALELSRTGHTNELRSLSLLHSEVVRSARDEKGLSCLHLAVMEGHYQTCRWLLSEASMDVDQAMFQYAKVHDYDDILSLLESFSKT